MGTLVNRKSVRDALKVVVEQCQFTGGCIRPKAEVDVEFVCFVMRRSHALDKEWAEDYLRGIEDEVSKHEGNLYVVKIQVNHDPSGLYAKAELAKEVTGND